MKYKTTALAFAMLILMVFSNKVLHAQNVLGHLSVVFYNDRGIAIDTFYWRPDQAENRTDNGFPATASEITIEALPETPGSLREVYVNDVLYPWYSIREIDTEDFLELKVYIYEYGSDSRDSYIAALHRSELQGNCGLEPIHFFIENQEGTLFFPHDSLDPDLPEIIVDVPKSADSIYITLTPQSELATVMATDETGLILDRDLDCEKFTYKILLIDTVTTVYVTVTAEDHHISKKSTINIYKRTESSKNTSITDVFCNYLKKGSDAPVKMDVSVSDGQLSYLVRFPAKIDGYTFSVLPADYVSRVLYIVDHEEYDGLEELVNFSKIDVTVTAENGDTAKYEFRFAEDRSLPTWLIIIISFAAFYMTLLIIKSIKRKRHSVRLKR